MKFCQICGRPLQDNEVCNCQAQRRSAPEDQRTVAADQAYQQAPYGAAPQQAPYGAAPQQAPQQAPYGAAPQQAPRAPRYAAPQQPQYNAASQQPYYGQPPQKAPEGKFVKALKNIPVVFKSYWTSSDKLEAAAKNGKDWILPLLFVCILFFVNLILGICYFARMTDSTFNYHRGLGMFVGTFSATPPFKFGFVLLGALIITVFSCSLYICFRFFSSLILCKKKPSDAFTDALVEFGIHSMPISLWLFLGALLSLATCWLTVPFVGMAMAYYVVIGVSNTIKECGATKNVFLRNLILAAFVMLAVGLTTWMFFLICQMNVGGTVTNAAQQAAWTL